MPFAISEEEKQKGQEAGGQTNISGTSTAINVPGQSAGAGAQTRSAQGPKTSGQFQNIQKYLQASQQQGTEMGQKIAGEVGREVGEATQAGQAIASEVKAPTAYNPSDVLSKLPTATEEEKKTYKTMKATGGYTGPSDITGLGSYGTYQKEKGQAEAALGQAGTEVGQQELLKKTYARPDYGRGMNALDQALLMQSQGGRAAIEGAAQQYQPIVQALGGYGEQAGQAITGAQTQAAQNIAGFAPAEQAAQAAIMTPIEQRAAQARAEAAKVKGYYEDVSDLNLSPETMAALGLTAGQRTFGVNLGQFINQPLSPATAQNIATAQERQQYNDLLNFLGTNAGQLGMGEPTYQAGTVDKTGLSSQLQAKQQEFDTVMSKPAGELLQLDPGTNTTLGLSNVMTSALATMTLPQLVQAVNEGTLRRAGGGAESPTSWLGSQIINQYNQIMNQMGANNIVQGGV